MESLPDLNLFNFYGLVSKNKWEVFMTKIHEESCRCEPIQLQIFMILLWTRPFGSFIFIFLWCLVMYCVLLCLLTFFFFLNLLDVFVIENKVDLQFGSSLSLVPLVCPFSLSFWFFQFHFFYYVCLFVCYVYFICLFVYYMCL